MTNILIAGLKEPPGGVESAVLEFTKNFSPDEFNITFAFTCGEISFYDRIDPWAVTYLPGRVRHPLQYRKALKKLFRDGGFDVLWCNYSGLTNIDFLKYAKKAGVKKRIIHSHAAMFSWGNALMKYLVPFFHKKNQKKVESITTDFWACSEKAAIFMYGEEIAKKTKIIPNCVNTQLFTPDEEARKNIRKEFGISESSIVLGHIGRMCTAKNHTFLLDIAKKAAELNNDACLLFVGDGELKDMTLSYCNEIGISDKVIFTGSRRDIPALLQAMDVFLLPSITEGFPVTIVEAQAAGVPCVVSEEAVTKTADLTGAVTYISLNEAPAVWAKSALDASKNRIADGAETVKDAGYDCITQAQSLQSFFKGV